MAQEVKAQVVNDADPLAAARNSVAAAIEKCRAFEGTAGSRAMRNVQSALEYLGYAYSNLTPDNDTGNPAWKRD